MVLIVKEKQPGSQLRLMGSRYLNLRASPSPRMQGDFKSLALSSQSSHKVFR